MAANDRGGRFSGGPLGRQILILLQPEPDQAAAVRHPPRELPRDPADEVLTRRDRLAVRELRQRGVEVLMVEPLDDLIPDQGVERAEVDHEAGPRIDLAAHGHEQVVVVAVPRQVGAFAEAGPVLGLAPVGTAVEMAGAEAVPAFEGDIHGDLHIMAPVRKLDRYLITEILGPLGLGFLVYTFILLIRFLFQSAEMIIRRGLPVSIVGKLLALTLPNIVVLTLPMSLLFGTLIAVGRLSSDSELIAVRASGISLLTLYRPILLLSGLLTLLNAALMVYVLPWGNHALQELRLDITTQSVAQQIEPRVFYEEWEGKVVYVFEVPTGSKRWKGVFLAEAIPSTDKNQITTADWGEVLVDPSGERVVLRLYNAVRHKVDLNAPDRYEFSRHKRLDLILDDQFATEQRAKLTASKGIREMTLKELAQQRDDPSNPAEQRNLAQVEIHK